MLSARERSSGAAANGALALPGEFAAAVFDFDGLLVESEPGWSRAEAELLARRGVVYTEADRRATAGRSIDQSVLAYATRLGLAPAQLPALRAELADLARAEYLSGVESRPGAADLVGALQRHMRLGLVSNTDRALIDLALPRTPFAASFDVVVTRDDVERPKPDPDIYTLACERLRVRPSEVVAFEDSVPGVLAAKAAGLTVVAVPQLPGLDLEAADVVIASLRDLIVGRERSA